MKKVCNFLASQVFNIISCWRNTLRKTYQYRAYLNKQTTVNTLNAIELYRQLYNLSLEQRIYAWKQRKKSLSYYDQQDELKYFKKEFDEYRNYDVQSLRDVLQRVDKAFQNFFRRVKLGIGKGFPRFKGKGRYDSITFVQNGWKLEGKYLIIKTLGKFKLKLSRQIPKEAKIKTVTIRRSQTNKWYVSFSLDNVPQNILPKNDDVIAFDVGCESFLTDSNGLKVENPRYLKKSQDKITKIQQKLSKQKKGSNRRDKTKLRLCRAFENVNNQRKDFHYQVANHYIKHYGTIIHEDLKSWVTEWKSLNKSMRDVSWFNFFEVLKNKAAEAGREIIKVNPKNTSQICSNCGQIVKKSLSERIHKCPKCNLTMDRDENAAINLLRVGSTLRPPTAKVENVHLIA
jgi:putative transposase